MTEMSTQLPRQMGLIPIWDFTCERSVLRLSGALGNRVSHGHVPGI